MHHTDYSKNIRKARHSVNTKNRVDRPVAETEHNSVLQLALVIALLLATMLSLDPANAAGRVPTATPTGAMTEHEIIDASTALIPAYTSRQGLTLTGVENKSQAILLETQLLQDTEQSSGYLTLEQHFSNHTNEQVRGLYSIGLPLDTEIRAISIQVGNKTIATNSMSSQRFANQHLLRVGITEINPGQTVRVQLYMFVPDAIEG